MLKQFQYISKLISLLIILFLVSCSSQSMDVFVEEGEAISRTTVKVLQGVHTREDLVAAAPHLKEIHNRLVAVMIRAHEYRDKHPKAETSSVGDASVSDNLRAELSKVYRLEGGRELIEKCQEEALNTLDAYLKVWNRRHQPELKD